MTPNPQAVLADFAFRMAAVISPDLKTPFLMGSSGLMAAILGMMAEEWDRAAARLAEENKSIRGLMNRALTLSPPPELEGRLIELAGGADEDLRVSALQADNNLLRGALVDLQTWVEGRSDGGPLNNAIWAELAKSTERRRFATAGF